MPKVRIDNREVEVPAGATLLDAARQLGIEVPTMCHLEGLAPATSCMLCVVKVAGEQRLTPSCGRLAEEGMVVETDTPEVRDARRAALELLLSDHLGDCDAPCQVAQPQHIHIPRMIRHIAAGRLDEALAEIEAACPVGTSPDDLDGTRPERACRRSQHDQPVAIDALMRHVLSAAGRSFRPKAAEPRPRAFSVHIGRIDETEMAEFLATASREERTRPADPSRGLTAEEAKAEAARCLHCDCRAADACKLRDLAVEYGAKAATYKGERRRFVRHREHPRVVYEPGKCVACGLCVRLTRQLGEPVGLTFVDRGFGVRVAPPLGKTLAEALTFSAERCVEACPTGALAFWEQPQR